MLFLAFLAFTAIYVKLKYVNFTLIVTMLHSKPCRLARFLLYMAPSLFVTTVFYLDTYLNTDICSVRLVRSLQNHACEPQAPNGGPPPSNLLVCIGFKKMLSRLYILIDCGHTVVLFIR